MSANHKDPDRINGGWEPVAGQKIDTSSLREIRDDFFQLWARLDVCLMSPCCLFVFRELYVATERVTKRG